MAKLTANSLTREQLDMMSTVRQEYIEALTKDFDDEDIIKKVKWLYKLYGLHDPHVHILDSPQQYKLERAERYAKGGDIQEEIINKLLYDLWRQMQKSLDQSTLDLVKREILQKISGLYENHVALKRFIRRALWNIFRETDIGREHNIPLLSMYDYFLRIGVIKDPSESKDTEKFIAYMRSYGVMYGIYNQNHAYIIRNNNGPQFRDELGRLNNEQGYAVVWRVNKDGKIESGLHFVKGVYFQQELFYKIFIKKDICSEEIFGIENTEQKAVAIHHIGYDKFIKELGAEKLDTWITESVINGNIAVCNLYQFKLDGDRLRFVEVQDHSTGKKTVLGVPIIEDTRTAKGAVAWTFGKKECEYNPTIET